MKESKNKRVKGSTNKDKKKDIGGMIIEIETVDWECGVKTKFVESWREDDGGCCHLRGGRGASSIGV